MPFLFASLVNLGLLGLLCAVFATGGLVPTGRRLRFRFSRSAAECRRSFSFDMVRCAIESLVGVLSKLFLLVHSRPPNPRPQSTSMSECIVCSYLQFGCTLMQQPQNLFNKNIERTKHLFNKIIESCLVCCIQLLFNKFIEKLFSLLHCMCLQFGGTCVSKFGG